MVFEMRDAPADLSVELLRPYVPYEVIDGLVDVVKRLRESRPPTRALSFQVRQLWAIMGRVRRRG